MSWIGFRIFLALVAIGLGALISLLLQDWLKMPVVANLIGVASASLGLLVLDGVRGHRLLSWLRGNQESSAPRDTGLWGELGYRVERALRLREQALARERLQLQQFLSAIEASPNGVLMLDTQDQIQWCNRVAADHFSLDPQRDLLQRVTNLVRSPTFVDYLHQGLYTEPLMLPNPRGPGSLSVIVRCYADGLRLVLSQDVTERERAEAMRRDFVANVSHEIRTPLTVLTGFIETMGSLPLTEAERKRVIVLMEQQTQRMLTLVSDLLTLAQLEGSPRPGGDRWITVDGLLARVSADAVALSAGRHRISCEAKSQLEIAGNESELLSAIGNLATNAVRYTPDGGAIDIGWRLQADGCLQLWVHDTGPGIAKEHLPRLAERFYRVDGSRSRETGGTGLGLSIVKHVMQRHGGSLQIESELGRGSDFALLLPAVRVRAIAIAETETSAAASR
ncbi:phosphate regulon sensor histidine kinase PhoR [Roseateles sp.]|uniref:phosphate regulon sensor histidine kinase PhoR n=1 Tax=Roseateles sp. TaxID=1971397 RepID=UPI0037C5CEFE